MSIAIELFVIGFSSYFGPCLIYCTPVVFPYIAASREDTISRIRAILIFSFSRFFVHIILGLLAVIFGRTLMSVFSDFSEIFFLIFGLVIMLFGILVLLGKKHIWHKPLPGRATKWLKGWRNKDLVLLGVLIALFPCVPRLGVLAYIALEAKTLTQGLLYSSAFGLGEFISPVILFGAVINFLPVILTGKFKLFFNFLCGLLLVILGLSFLVK